MNAELSVQPAPNTRKQIRSMLRKSSWFIEQARLLVLQAQPELDTNTNDFARNLEDVQRHLVATSQRFFKTEHNADREHHETIRTT